MEYLLVLLLLSYLNLSDYFKPSTELGLSVYILKFISLHYLLGVFFGLHFAGRIYIDCIKKNMSTGKCYFLYIFFQDSKLGVRKTFIIKKWQLGQWIFFILLLYQRMHVIIHLSKLIEYMAQRVNPDINYGFQLIIIC